MPNLVSKRLGIWPLVEQDSVVAIAEAQPPTSSIDLGTGAIEPASDSTNADRGMISFETIESQIGIVGVYIHIHLLEVVSVETELRYLWVRYSTLYQR